MEFLRAAFLLSRNSVYSLHKSSTRGGWMSRWVVVGWVGSCGLRIHQHSARGGSVGSCGLRAAAQHAGRLGCQAANPHAQQAPSPPTLAPSPDYIQRLATKELRAQSGRGRVDSWVQRGAYVMAPGVAAAWQAQALFNASLQQLCVTPAPYTCPHPRLPACSRGAGAAAVRPACDLQVPQVRPTIVVWVCGLVEGCGTTCPPLTSSTSETNRCSLGLRVG